MTNEPVKTQRFHRMMHVVKRLNLVHPSLLPEHIKTAMRRFMKESQPGDIVPLPRVLDEWGRARGAGRRKTSSAVVWLVEGEGEVLVNGKSLSQFFGRLHHRESAVWALKATQRLDKYNVFGLVQGGGSTGQAEALTLAVAKALLVHGKCCCCEACETCGQIANIIQPAPLLGIQGRWKGRRLVISRRARCPLGSSVRRFVQCILSLCISIHSCCNILGCQATMSLAICIFVFTCFFLGQCSPRADICMKHSPRADVCMKHSPRADVCVKHSHQPRAYWLVVASMFPRRLNGRSWVMGSNGIQRRFGTKGSNSIPCARSRLTLAMQGVAERYVVRSIRGTPPADQHSYCAHGICSLEQPISCPSARQVTLPIWRSWRIGKCEAAEQDMGEHASVPRFQSIPAWPAWRTRCSSRPTTHGSCFFFVSPIPCRSSDTCEIH
jgi:ribosomal protein S9